MGSGQWYFTRVEIQKKSPSRCDGISLKKESGVRQSYCLFLREFGAKLQLPAHTVSYAILLCHQFFMRQSLAKNDWQIVANSSMLVACKFQETLKPLNDIVFVGYEIAHKSDPTALQRIRHREFFRKQRELILQGEILVLQTIGFDSDRIKLPYAPLLAGLKCFDIGASSDIGKLAWCLVDELVRSTMSLEFKPNCLAAGSVAIAAELLHVKQSKPDVLNGKYLWYEFETDRRHFHEVIGRMHCMIVKADGKPALQPPPVPTPMPMPPPPPLPANEKTKTEDGHTESRVNRGRKRDELHDDRKSRYKSVRVRDDHYESYRFGKADLNWSRSDALKRRRCEYYVRDTQTAWKKQRIVF